MTAPDRAAGAWITRARWAQLEPLIDAALDLAPDQRAAFYESVASSHPDLRADLERLVGRADDEPDLFTSAAAERFVLLFDEGRQPEDILPQLQASLGTAYSLERELGGGGMSRVFLARESELGRRVVIKVLPSELAAGINAEWFDREIKLAASLQQANIVPLLATGRAAGYAYYTMPFVEGRSLRERLMREGVLPIGDGVNLLRDIARALAYAHAQGVVHRDIKPGNVLLSGGTAVVTDFGIAKALTAARRDGGLEAISHGGPAIGTPPYMAPEQAAGDPAVDHRADIYAFGCLAYEVFTGKPPFHGHAPHIIIAAHFQETPRPVTEERSDVPPAIAALIAQCLEKNPARRPQSAADLLDALDVVTSQPTRTVRHRTTAMLLRGAVAVTVMVGGATAYLVYRNARAADNIATLPPLTTVSGEALDAYRDGQVLLTRRGPAIKESVKRFEAAIRLDPTFAQAYGALATALTFYPWFFGTPPNEVRDTVLNTARRALALDSTVADAHSAIAMVLANAGEWDSATTHFRRALTLEPNFDTHFNFGRVSTLRGDLREARRQFEQARTFERASPLLSAWSSYVYFLNGQLDLARTESLRAFRLDSTQGAVRNLGALLYVASGDTGEARRLAGGHPQPPGPMATASYVYAKLHDTVTALRRLTEMESTNPRPWAVDVQRATVLLALRDTARALSVLEQSARTIGPMWIAIIPPCDPAWDVVRPSRRFAALVRRAGLDERSLTVAGGCSR